MPKYKGVILWDSYKMYRKNRKQGSAGIPADAEIRQISLKAA